MGNYFSFDQIPNLSNKVYAITGSNTGIGYATALEIARRNGHVIMCCRSEHKANVAIRKIRHELKSQGTCGKLEYIPLDLMSLKSAETAARLIRKQYSRLDCIINNAGISCSPFKLTYDKIESQFGTNHMGHFVFTMLLVPLLLKTVNSRIVNVSSDLHYIPYNTGILTIDQLLVTPGTSSFEKSRAEKVYRRWNAYGSSKLANILFTKYLACHLPVKCYAVHPGYVKTEIFRNMADIRAFQMLVNSVWFFIARSPSQGSITTLRAATDPVLDSDEGKQIAPSGTYFVPQGQPQVPSKYACDSKLAHQMWDLSIMICRLVLGDQVTDEIQVNLTNRV